MPAVDDPRPESSRPALDSTVTLLDRYRGGDTGARDQLVARYLPVLRRWARGRLPSAARDMQDTEDLVQNTFLSSLAQLGHFRPEHEGAFLAYLRRALMNRVRDEIRRVRRRPLRDELPSSIADETRSPLDRLIGHDMLERYESALELLPAPQREAIVMRVEMGYSYREIAQAVGQPSENAARMAIVRGLARLAEHIGA